MKYFSTYVPLVMLQHAINRSGNFIVFEVDPLEGLGLCLVLMLIADLYILLI